MNPYILELLLIVLLVIAIGVVVTQMIIPIIYRKQPWWFFRKGADRKMDEVMRDLDEEQRLIVLDKAEKELKKLREDRKKAKS
jgi:hypothetical protein